MQKIKKIIKSIFKLFNLDITLYRPERTDVGLISKVIRNNDINLVLDIGANRGQFASSIINKGYLGKIISFEPLTSAHDELEKKSNSHSNWEVYPRCAIGDTNSEIRINIAGNSESSSILSMLDTHLKAAPQSRYVSSEMSPIYTLDNVASKFINEYTKLFIKIDTQGYEWQVLEGARECLKYANVVQLELSLVPLYDNQHLWKDIVLYMENMEFELWLILPGFCDITLARTLQMDAIFVRRH